MMAAHVMARHLVRTVAKLTSVLLPLSASVLACPLLMVVGACTVYCQLVMLLAVQWGMRVLLLVLVSKLWAHPGLSAPAGALPSARLELPSITRATWAFQGAALSAVSRMIWTVLPD